MVAHLVDKFFNVHCSQRPSTGFCKDPVEFSPIFKVYFLRCILIYLPICTCVVQEVSSPEFLVLICCDMYLYCRHVRCVFRPSDPSRFTYCVNIRRKIQILKFFALVA